MGLYKKIDLWSIMDKLSDIMEGRYNSCFDNSEYVYSYEENLLELQNLSGILWNEFEELKSKIFYRDIPYKTRKFATEDDDTENAAYWFNTAVLLLTETDADTLFYREDNFEDAEVLRQKRINMFEKLSKADAIWLLTEVSSFVMRFLELECAYEAIKGTIAELDERQAFVKKNDELMPPKSSYIA